VRAFRLRLINSLSGLIARVGQVTSAFFSGMDPVCALFQWVVLEQLPESQGRSARSGVPGGRGVDAHDLCEVRSGSSRLFRSSSWLRR